MPDHCYVTIKISAFCLKYHFHQFASYLLKMFFSRKEKAFWVLEFDKNNLWGHMLNVNLGKNFESRPTYHTEKLILYACSSLPKNGLPF